MENSEVNSQEETKKIEKASPGKIISLSKANKLRNLVKERLSVVEQKVREAAMTHFTVDENDVPETIQAKREKIITNAENYLNTFNILNQIHTSLRVIIANANEEAGLNKVLSQIEEVRISLNQVKGTLSFRTFSAYEAERLIKTNDDIRNQKASINQSSVVQNFRQGNFFALPEEFGENARGQILQLEKVIRDLEEKRNELNYSTTIALDGQVVQVLTELAII